MHVCILSTEDYVNLAVYVSSYEFSLLYLKAGDAEGRGSHYEDQRDGREEGHTC